MSFLERQSCHLGHARNKLELRILWLPTQHQDPKDGIQLTNEPPDQSLVLAFEQTQVEHPSDQPLY